MSDLVNPQQVEITYETEEPVLYDVTDGVAWITMNQPKFNNAQNGQMTYALDDTFKQAVNQVEELRGKSSAMTSVFHMHHFAHAQNDLTQGSSIAGLDAKAMASANKTQAGET